MTVLFDCQTCGLKQVPVEVAERGKAEALSRWLQLVSRIVGLRHATLSDNCRSGKVDLRFPAPVAASGVGRRERS